MAGLVIGHNKPNSIRKLENVRNIIYPIPSHAEIVIYSERKGDFCPGKDSKNLNAEQSLAVNLVSWKVMPFKLFVLFVVLSLTRVGWSAPKLYSGCTSLNQP